MLTRALCFSTLCLGILSTGIVLGDGLILNGINPRSVGRGGTNIGFADNGGVWIDNPAAAVNMKRKTMFDAGVDLLSTDFKYSDPDNTSRSSTGFTPLPQYSFTRKTDSERFAYGVGFYCPAGFSEDYELNGPAPLAGRQNYQSMGMLAKLLPGIAFKVNDRLSVGGTFGMGFSQVNLEGPLFVQTGFLRGTPTLIDLETDGITSVWTLGLQYQLNDSTTLGASYQSQSKFDLDGTARVQIPLAGGSKYDATLGITWPQSLGGGVRHELDDRQTLSMDVIWYDWSGALDQLDLRLQNPSNPFFIPLKDQLPLNWRDSVSIRAGYEYELDHNRTLRFGYVYHHNPIPNSTLTPYLQAILQHTVSVGYGWEWKKVELDLGYRFLFGETEDVGTSALVGGDFSGSRHRAYAHSLAFGIRWGS